MPGLAEAARYLTVGEADIARVYLYGHDIDSFVFDRESRHRLRRRYSHTRYPVDDAGGGRGNGGNAPEDAAAAIIIYMDWPPVLP